MLSLVKYFTEGVLDFSKNSFVAVGLVCIALSLAALWGLFFFVMGALPDVVVGRETELGSELIFSKDYVIALPGFATFFAALNLLLAGVGQRRVPNIVTFLFRIDFTLLFLAFLGLYLLYVLNT